MTRNAFKLLLVVCMYIYGAGTQIAHAQTVPASEVRMTSKTAPAPLTGAYKLYVDTADGTFHCLNPSGISCMPAAGGGGTGTVTSVGLTVPGVLFTVSGSPITGAGSFTFTLINQSANTFLAGPATGGAVAPGFRSIVVADIPTLNQSTTGNAATATALDHTPTLCAAGSYATGITASGAGTGCTVEHLGTTTTFTTTTWPSWLTPAVTDPTTTPNLNVTASTIPISAGGTNANTAAAALTSLGAEATVNKNAASGYAGLDASAHTTAAEEPAHTGDVTNAAGALALTLAGSIPGTHNFTGLISAKEFDTFSVCDNAAFANTAACQTDAGTTGGMLMPPGYTVGAFTNPNNRPVFDFSVVDWRGFVNVRDFGAKGDWNGTTGTDNSAAIQAAINFLCVPVNNVCTSSGGTVWFPAGAYKTTVPILQYGSNQAGLVGAIYLKGTGQRSSRIVKTTNTVGTLASITAGTGVGRTATSCAGSTPCVDAFNNDAIIQVPYNNSGATSYAFYWGISDLALTSAATNGTLYGIYAPRSAQFTVDNVAIDLNCPQGNQAGCGSVTGYGFYTHDAWAYRMTGVKAASSSFGWGHIDDGSALGTGAAASYNNNYGLNLGYSCLYFSGINDFTINGQACDNVNAAQLDIVNINHTYASYSFNSSSGVSMTGTDTEGVFGQILYVGGGSLTLNGAFKTFNVHGFTSATTAAAVYMESAASVSMNNTKLGSILTPGNFFNFVLQGGSSLHTDNATMPTGGNAFTSYGGGSLWQDCGLNGCTWTNASGVPITLNPTAPSSFMFPLNKVGQADIVASSAAINTTDTIIVKTPALVANRLINGSHWQAQLMGTCTSSAANTSTFTVRWGTAGTTSDGTVAALVSNAAATTGTNAGFKANVDLTVRAAGASATSNAFLDLSSDANTGISATPSEKSVVGTAFNTTTANGILSVSYKSAASTTTCTFTNATIRPIFN